MGGVVWRARWCRCVEAVDARGSEREVCECPEGVFIDGSPTPYRSIDEAMYYEGLEPSW